MNVQLINSVQIRLTDSPYIFLTNDVCLALQAAHSFRSMAPPALHEQYNILALQMHRDFLSTWRASRCMMVSINQDHD